MTVKDMFRDGYIRITDALDGCGADRETVNTVTAAYRNVCYQFARLNAVSCVFEEIVMDADRELWAMATNPARNNDAIMKRFGEAIPEEWLEAEDDENVEERRGGGEGGA